MKQYFNEIKSDLYQYMITEGGLQKKTSRDYISRLLFLAKYYRIDSTLTNEKMEQILQQEKNAIKGRDFYNTKHAIGDFHAGLRKVLQFLQSDFVNRKKYEEVQEEESIKADTRINTTEKKQIILARIGQGTFRSRLIEYWQGCAVSGCDLIEIMIASHIKPWKVSDNIERLDYFNGLLLLPNYDKLFDKGLMTFDVDGRAVFSSLITTDELNSMGIGKDVHLSHIDDRHKRYLDYHNQQCFIE